MKNIFVLPTDRPSRLGLNNGIVEYAQLFGFEFFDKNKNFRHNPVNNHITSDEEPKHLDYYITKIKDSNGERYSVGQRLDTNDSDYSNCKKIILTTDPKLIADGVQSIDDEFLQWFVKNPSCEYVEVTNDLLIKKDGITELMKNEYYQKFPEELPYCVFINDYKIITPKEEPKPIWKQIIEDCGGNEAFMEAAGLKPKQETLEELAKNTTKKYINEREKQTAYLEFINGYQLAKEQDKNKYSEEDMMEAVRFGTLYKSDSSKKLFEKKGMTPTEVLKKWFDKVKKK
jgi:hypothetical protein